MSLKSLLLRMEHLMLKATPGLITCAEAEAFLDDYLDGRLPDQVRRRFERHIAMCRPCRSYLDAYRRSLSLTKATAAKDEAATKMPEDLLQAILAAREGSEG